MPAVQFFAKMENNNRQDDGSLAFLQIEPDANNKHFNCPENKPAKVNQSFVLGCRTIWTTLKRSSEITASWLKIKFKLEDTDSEARKFFTNSQEIKYILGKIKERNAFSSKSNYEGFGNTVLF